MSGEKVHVILLAGGSGSRMGAGRNKVLLFLRGRSILRRSAEAFAGFASDMTVVCRPEDEESIREEIRAASLPFPVDYTHGGQTRQESVAHGLNALSASPEDAVLVHDAARCLVDGGTIQRVLDAIRTLGNGIASVPVKDTVKTLQAESRAGETLPRERLRAMQTPQGFRVGELKEAMDRAEADGFLGTDDASLLEHLGRPVYLTEGSERNIKMTTREDLIMAEGLLTEGLPSLRVGQGYDVHQLFPGRKLILCGVEIPCEYGLLGHSDADVALHALMDAMLGAAALGDIGRHFPDSDEKYRGISSLVLLRHVRALLAEQHLSVANADVTIVAQKPRLSPWIPSMVRSVAEALSLPENRVNIKATTTEHLGFEGRLEGISSQAVCLLQEIR